MSEFIVEVEGSNSMDQIERAISGLEATGAEFVRSSISFHEGKITNLATFNDLLPGERPQNPLIFVEHGDSMPDGKPAIWAGVLLVAGALVAISAHRQ